MSVAGREIRAAISICWTADGPLQSCPALQAGSRWAWTRMRAPSFLFAKMGSFTCSFVIAQPAPRLSGQFNVTLAVGIASSSRLAMLEAFESPNSSL